MFFLWWKLASIQVAINVEKKKNSYRMLRYDWLKTTVSGIHYAAWTLMLTASFLHLGDMGDIKMLFALKIDVSCLIWVKYEPHELAWLNYHPEYEYFILSVTQYSNPLLLHQHFALISLHILDIYSTHIAVCAEL